MWRRLMLPICLLLAVVCHMTIGRSVFLKRLAERRDSDDFIKNFYRELNDFVELKERDTRRPNFDSSEFLERFGYLQNLPPGKSHDHASRKNAIKNFQRMYNLEETGELDATTLNAMAAPRCGMPDTKPVVYTEPTDPDVGKRYFVPGTYKWPKTDLSFRFRNFASTPNVDREAQKRAFLRAFKMWSDVSPLTFRETADRGDLNLEFVSGAHTDGPQNAFDGPGGVLAHAFYPTSGELHLDDTEQWVDSKEEGVDIMTVAAHELGHALGLGHSAVPGALMAPYYQGYDPEFTLPQDDIDAIQSLYGAKPKGNDGKPVVTSKPAPTTKTTTTTTTTTTPTPVVTKPGGQPSTCSVPFRAVTQIHDNSIMIFNGQWLWRLTGEGLADGYPIRTRSLYRSAPSVVDAAIYSRRTYYTYLFYGKALWRYHGFDLIDTHTIATQSFSGSITDVIALADGTFYLIKGTDCWLFDEQELAVGVNPSACTAIFGSEFPNAIDSTLQLADEPNYAYIFRGANYIKYNLATKRKERGYPKPKAGPWLGPTCGGSPYSPK